MGKAWLFMGLELAQDVTFLDQGGSLNFCHVLRKPSQLMGMVQKETFRKRMYKMYIYFEKLSPSQDREVSQFTSYCVWESFQRKSKETIKLKKTSIGLSDIQKCHLLFLSSGIFISVETLSGISKLKQISKSVFFPFFLKVACICFRGSSSMQIGGNAALPWRMIKLKRDHHELNSSVPQCDLCLL